MYSKTLNLLKNITKKYKKITIYILDRITNIFNKKLKNE